jgi:hypothetical protein
LEKVFPFPPFFGQEDCKVQKDKINRQERQERQAETPEKVGALHFPLALLAFLAVQNTTLQLSWFFGVRNNCGFQEVDIRHLLRFVSVARNGSKTITSFRHVADS